MPKPTMKRSRETDVDTTDNHQQDDFPDNAGPTDDGLTDDESFDVLTREVSASLSSASASSDVEVVSESLVEFQDELGLDAASLRPLARALGVDLTVAPVETLSYSLLCKVSRGMALSKQHILEVWDVVPSRFKLRDAGDRSSMVVFGANPRNTKSLSVISGNLPHTFELIQAFLRQLRPDFKYSCVCLRQNCMRGPHRDTRNIGDNLVLSLTEHEGGGGLWVADPLGQVTMIHQGLSLKGRVQDISEPFIFPARNVLHATQPWTEPRRTILVAFTPIGTLTLQSHNLNPHKVRQTRIQDYFHSTNLAN